jgi:hypothetical protein
MCVAIDLYLDLWLPSPARYPSVPPSGFLFACHPHCLLTRVIVRNARTPEPRVPDDLPDRGSVGLSQVSLDDEVPGANEKDTDALLQLPPGLDGGAEVNETQINVRTNLLLSVNHIMHVCGECMHVRTSGVCVCQERT